MSSPSLAAPVVSTDLIGSLDAVIPVDAFEPSVTARTHVAREARRTRQVLLTAVPLAAIDLFSLTICFLVAVVSSSWMTGYPPSVGSHLHLGALAFCYMLIGWMFRLYPGSAMSPIYELRQQVIAVSLSYLLLLVLNGTFGKIVAVETVTFLAGTGISILVMPLTRHMARHLCAMFSWWGEPVIIVGATRQGRSLYRFLKKTQQRGLRPVGVVDDPHRTWSTTDDEADPPYLGSIDELQSIAHAHGAFWTIAAIADRTTSDAREILNRCSMTPNLIVFPTQVMLPSLWAESRGCGGQAGLLIRDQLLFFWPRFFKRLADLVVASVLMLLSAPFFIVATVLIRLSSKGPVFYGHSRIGRNGLSFKAWKLRTMVLGADKVLEHYFDQHPELCEEWVQTQKLKNDPRIIPGIGSFLRKTSLDELPQLWNVFIGEMSLVGPRPITTGEIDRYNEVFSLYLRIRPGVTGLWQISGRNHVGYVDRVRLDTFYVRNWSVWLDYYILLRTIRTIALREGAF